MAAEKVTMIPERKKVFSNKRLNKRQTTLRAFTFTRDWELRVSPIPIIKGPVGSSQGSSSPIPRISPGPVVIETASVRSQINHSDETESSGPSFRHPKTPPSHDKTRRRQSTIHDSVSAKTVLESTRLSADSLTDEPSTSTSSDHDLSSQPITSSGENGGKTGDVSQLQRPDIDEGDSGRSRRSRLTVVAENLGNSKLQSETSSNMSAVSKSPREEVDVNVDNDSNLAITPPNRMKKPTTPSPSPLAILTSPKSGPAFRNKGNLKRRSPTKGKESEKGEPLPKGKVCLWTASDRTRSANDVNELDVVLSNIEEVCLDYREDLTEKPHRKAVSRFFLNTRKDFTEMIALRQEQKFLQSAVRKAKTDVNKKRKLLLSLQQQNARLTVDIDRLKKKQTDDQHHALESISQFLEGLQDLQVKANQIQDSDDSTSHKGNIPALLMESAQMSKVNVSLRSSSRKRKK